MAMARDQYIMFVLLAAFVVVSAVLAVWIGDGMNLQYAWEAAPSVDVSGAVALGG